MDGCWRQELPSSRPRAARASSEPKLHTEENSERNAVIKPKHKFETELAYAMRSRGSNRQAFLKQPLKITLIVTEHEKNKTKHKRLEI